MLCHHHVRAADNSKLSAWVLPPGMSNPADGECEQTVVTPGFTVVCLSLVHLLQALGKDPRTVPAGGATEIELGRQVADFGKRATGLEQYSIHKFAEAFEVVPRTLAENSGLNATDVLSTLYAAHANGQVSRAGGGVPWGWFVS